MADSIYGIVNALLPRLDEERLQKLVERLVVVVGIEEIGDLRYVKEDDISDLLKPCQCRKVIDSFQRRDCTTQPLPSSVVQLLYTTPPTTQTATSSPSGDTTMSSPYTLPSSQWLKDFQIPWEKMPLELRQSMDRELRAAQSDRLKMIRITVDAIRCHCINPSRSQCAEIARNVVTQYPKTFGDVTDDGDVLGCGYSSLLNQIKTRVEHLNRNNTLSKVRQPKRKDAERTFPRNSLNQQDSYGCVNWQPKYLPEGETPDSLEVKRQMLTCLFTTEGPRRADTGRVDELMAITYWKQRDFINSNPPPQVSTISEEWPFLFETRWLCAHFETLTGIDLLSRLSEAFQNKGRRIVNFFFQQRLKWKGSVLSLLKELEDDHRTFEDPNLVAIAAVLLLMVFFKEPTESLFILADGTATQVDIEAESLPDTPRLIMLGQSLVTSTKWMLSIEGQLYITTMDNFATAFATLFATYYVLNMQYQEDAACTLELVQRFLVRINPEEGKKCSARQGVSKKTGKVVQRKAVPISPLVNNFIRSLLDFEWQTAN